MKPNFDQNWTTTNGGVPLNDSEVERYIGVVPVSYTHLIRFISIGENIDTLNGTDVILMPIINVINSHYPRTKCPNSQRTKRKNRRDVYKRQEQRRSVKDPPSSA